ncbi:16S rRNA (cytidine1402-2'-O)-methyltransferase [Sphingomonas aerolata]|jgi:16S rRNA (cytidine1402-2'-O)-methyltransferase|uniref:Ribosomal RNA small subunit methyltransferase I n=1 Tax=Sphingomonas aerolata TaxID=185951 RepID=A0A2T4YQU2_9SPHN|nr:MULTISPECIES: 16S rRNA (cytidine(1402)-2'-O)-methyltransferase [Sphingomonas]MDY1008581.1 16S rRNA (cytidine(1402)-2'-O)-methyltransferase [Sphingomonas sp. CFBP9019]NII58991.1 16S rRNA (cytidine1402-2'-O)-methyltransferase [Sphingomonas aerolata]PTM45879.1 16S rRNA (cytidine1402-2'-O)-methyltransferase [Sphingomonas aerolata]
MNPETPLNPGLYIVATPIGNLGDLSPRAADILARADVVAVEDSRVTAGLLRHVGTKTPMVPYHDHSAEGVRPALIARMATEAVALVSDAGTPLISDPGFKLVRDARAAGHLVVTIPGPCAAVAALTLAGLPTDRFLFVGFLPSKAHARSEAIAEIATIRATLVLYESGPRLGASLAALAEGLGDREAAVTREITKRFEEAVTGTLTTLATRYADAPPRGEIVIVIAPPGDAPPASAEDADTALADALTRLSTGQAASEVAKALGLDRKTLYARALELKAKG